VATSGELWAQRWSKSKPPSTTLAITCLNDVISLRHLTHHLPLSYSLTSLLSAPNTFPLLNPTLISINGGPPLEINGPQELGPPPLICLLPTAPFKFLLRCFSIPPPLAFHHLYSTHFPTYLLFPSLRATCIPYYMSSTLASIHPVSRLDARLHVSPHVRWADNHSSEAISMIQMAIDRVNTECT